MHLSASLPSQFSAPSLWLQSLYITGSLTLSGANNNPLKLKLERSHIPGSLFYTHYCCADTQLSSTLLSVSSVQRLLPSASPGCRAAAQIHTQKLSQGSWQWTELPVPTRQGSDLVMFGCGSEQKILADNGMGQNMRASYITVTLRTWRKLLKITHHWLLASHMTQRAVFWGKVWVCLTCPPTQTSSFCGLGHSYIKSPEFCFLWRWNALFQTLKTRQNLAVMLSKRTNLSLFHFLFHCRL